MKGNGRFIGLTTGATIPWLDVIPAVISVAELEATDVLESFLVRVPTFPLLIRAFLLPQ
jgi:hypothetical protein